MKFKGIQIMTVYKYGSKALKYDDGNLNVPTLQWLGLKLTDLDNLFMKKKNEFLLKLNVHDRRIASSLIKKLSDLEEYELVNEVNLIFELYYLSKTF